jgi:hypothetical protein
MAMMPMIASGGSFSRDSNTLLPFLPGSGRQTGSV